MLHTSPDGGAAVSILGPVSARLPGGISLNVTGDYPFEDELTITLSGLPAGAPLTYPLYLRIPSWATGATLSVNGAAPTPIGAANGTMHRVAWGAGDAGPSAAITLALNPAIRAAPWYNGALAVSRGALLYSLRLDETFEVTGSAPLEARAADYIVSQPGCDLSPTAPACTALWNAAIVVEDGAHPEASFAFLRTGQVPPVPFAGGLWGASNLQLTAPVRTVAAWGIELNAAAPPPASPVDCSAPASCSAPYLATFVPYGATHLRMAELPWTSRPPCFTTLAYNGSSSAVASAGGVGDWVLSSGAGIVRNGGADNLRSGDPGQVSLAVYTSMVQDAALAVTVLSLYFRYVAGYGGDGAAGGAVVQLLALAPAPCSSNGGVGAVQRVLWSSQPLVHFPYDACATCYSPPQNVSLPAGSLQLNASAGVLLGLRVTNNERNVQLLLPVPVTGFWGA